MSKPLAIDLFCGLGGWTSSGSTSRKFASALIAKIPEPLSRHIPATFHPNRQK